MAATSPNIVLIMADQLAPQFTGAYGHPLVKTPAMQDLVSRGARFDAAYCNSPLCAPSRFSFMSGQWVTKIAAYDNASEFPASIPTFAHYLRMMDYQTCLSGKMHFVGPDQLHGFDERVTTDIYPADFAWTPDWELPDERIDKWYHNMDSVREAGVAAATFQIDYDEEVAFFAKRKLMDYAREAVQPFCMVASFIHPHDPYVAMKKWWDLYRSEDIDMPKNTLIDRQQDGFSKRLMEGIEADKVDVSDEQIVNARHAYYANTSYFDSKVGEIMETLEQTQLLDNTIVIVTADHGDMLGERGLWYKMNFFEHSARVPLIIAGPQIQTLQVKQACSLVDLFPTLIDIAAMDGREKPEFLEPVDGHSLIPHATGTPSQHDEAIGEYCAEMTPYPVFMIRRGRYKYIHCDADPALLFDLEVDPDELNNLAGDENLIDLVSQFEDEVSQRWDSEKIRIDVVATQKRRRSVYQAMQSGQIPSWDYNPPRDASQQYVRNHMDWTQAAVKTRFPPLSD